MPTVGEHSVLVEHAGGGWWVSTWARLGVLAGVTDRHTPPEWLLQRLDPLARVDADQVHGAGVAAIGPAASVGGPIPGCDSLITMSPRVALLARSADCLPLFMVDPMRRAVGLAHVGWRGVWRQLPLRTVLGLQDLYGCEPGWARALIGPGIRVCCYEVGPDVAALLAPHVRTARGRRMGDLVAATRAQLERAGVPASQILDSGACTCCDSDRWFSRRRDGADTGRMVSAIMLKA